jgi:PilZ domain-containing protein
LAGANSKKRTNSRPLRTVHLDSRISLFQTRITLDADRAKAAIFPFQPAWIRKPLCLQRLRAARQLRGTDRRCPSFWYIRTFRDQVLFVSAVLLSLDPTPAKLFFQSGGSALTASERRNTQRFQMRLPLTVRWTTGAAVGETSTESRDVSSRGVYFFLSKDVKQGSAIEILLTLPNEITLAGPVRVRCLGRVQRTEARDEGAIGVVAAIERYEFLRGDEDRKQ